MSALAGPATLTVPFNGTEFGIVVAVFALVTVLGFGAARWQRGGGLHSLGEWGLGGRRFGTWVTWFLLGGDLYTAYTFVAVPALVYGAGALGFFAVPYTIVVYPIVLFAAARLWSVAHAQGYVTAADFVRGRHGSDLLGVVIAVTGIVATMPYIALQLAGIKAVVEAMGIGGDWPLWIAFGVLALYTYSSGLRAPALIAFLKDTLIYAVVLAAVIYIPYKVGGYGHVFDAARRHFATTGKGSLTLKDSQYLYYSSLALGSALALFLYPHSVTGVLAAKSRATVKKNMALLPAYSLMLGFLALIGYMAIAVGVKAVAGDSNTITPMTYHAVFPDWFSGIAFAAIAIGALVPAAIMAIAAANTFTRDLYKPYLRPNASEKEEATVSKLVSVLVKFGALGILIGLKTKFALEFQLIGGVVVIQILPALVLGLYTRWVHRWALLAGWAVGMAVSVWMLYVTPPAGKTSGHFGSSAWSFTHWGLHTKVAVWIGIIGVLVNLVVALVLTPVLRRLPAGVDQTRPSDYHVEIGESGAGPLAATVDQQRAAGTA